MGIRFYCLVMVRPLMAERQPTKALLGFAKSLKAEVELQQ